MTQHLTYDTLRADTVRNVAQLMAAAAITAPKSGGQLFNAGKPNFIETVIVDIAVGLSLSLTHKAIGFDRKMPAVEDFDALDYPPTNTLPIGAEGAPRADGARNRQIPRNPLTS